MSPLRKSKYWPVKATVLLTLRTNLFTFKCSTVQRVKNFIFFFQNKDIFIKGFDFLYKKGRKGLLGHLFILSSLRNSEISIARSKLQNSSTNKLFPQHNLNKQSTIYRLAQWRQRVIRKTYSAFTYICSNIKKKNFRRYKIWTNWILKKIIPHKYSNISPWYEIEKLYQQIAHCGKIKMYHRQERHHRSVEHIQSTASYKEGLVLSANFNNNNQDYTEHDLLMIICPISGKSNQNW